MNIPLRTILLATASMLVASTAAPHGAAWAQAGEWTDVDAAGPAGLPLRTSPTMPGSLFYYTPNDGYRVLDRTDSTWWTRDGGETWHPEARTAIRPKGVLADGFAWLGSGYVSLDTGRSWTAPPNGRFHDYEVATRTTRAALMAWPGTSATRLAVTDDGGETWAPLDELAPIATDSQTVRTRFGPMPSPPLMEIRATRWQRIASFDGVRLVVISTAEGSIDAAATIRYYLNVIDLRARTIRSGELTMYRNFQVALVSMAMPHVSALGEARWIVGGHDYDTYLGRTRFERLWTTDDAGVTWTKHDSLAYIDEPRLRFFSPTYGVTSNARTTDGGRTWQRMGRPFGSVFHALDSARWFVADGSMLTGRTTDAGATWRRSASSAPYRAILAHAGHVVIGRDQRSVLVSSDRGATWSDVGRTTEIPDDLSHFVAMTWLDTASLPGTIVAVAGFVDERARRTARIVTSSDYGRTWSERGRVPALDGAAFAGDIFDMPLVMQTVPGIEGGPGGLYIGGYFGLLASTDDGVTWERRVDTLPIHALAMNSRSSGVAMSGDWESSSIGLYRTADGGRSWERTFATSTGYVYPATLAWTDYGYRALVADYSSDWKAWTVLSSSDGGSWVERRGEHDGPAIKGGDAWWLGPNRFIMVGRGASILASPDGGWSFAVHRDRDERFVHVRQDNPTVDIMYRPLLTAHDGRDIWVADWFRGLGRWTMADDVLSVSTAASRGALDARLALASDGGTALLTIDGVTAADAWLVDMLGARSRIALESGHGSLGARLDLSSLASGRYLVTVRSADGALALPLVVTR